MNNYTGTPKTFKDFLTESSLSRIYKHVKAHESGTISAFRYAAECNTGDIYSKSDNNTRSAKLKAKLLKLGYGVTVVNGVYIENYKTDDEREVKEKSFVVIDLKDSGKLKKDLIKLGSEFEQDSITFSKPSGEYYLISSNTCPKGYPGSGKIGVEIKLGKPFFGKSGEMHSKVNGRPFIFESTPCEHLVTMTDLSMAEIRGVLALSEESVENGCKL
jgi:hypothetical protein